MASVSGFGQTGPLRDKPAFDFVAQAYGGIMHMTGDPDGPPTFVGIGLADTNAGVHAFAAVGFALFQRERTGQGCHLDISMVDALVHMHETGIYAPSITADVATYEPYVPMRAGRHYQPSSPGGCFQGPRGLDRGVLHPGPDRRAVAGARPARARRRRAVPHQRRPARQPRRAHRADRGVDGRLRPTTTT